MAPGCSAALSTGGFSLFLFLDGRLLFEEPATEDAEALDRFRVGALSIC